MHSLFFVGRINLNQEGLFTGKWDGTGELRGVTFGVCLVFVEVVLQS